MHTNLAEALSRPLAEATGLPGTFYSAEALASESDRLFARRWTAVATGASLPNPGDMLAVDLAGWPLLLTRGKDRSIRAFFNICRHRGMRLVEGAACAQVIRCPWHSWSYGLDGRLLATPHAGGPGVSEAFPDKAELGLKPVRSAMWLDYVFVDISGEAPPFADHLGPLAADLEGAGLEELVHEGRWDHAYPGNWKIAMEGAVEDYHVPWGHPQLLVDGTWRPSVTWGQVGLYSVTAGKDGVGTAQGSEIGLPPIAFPERYRNCVLNIFPTAVLGFAPDHMMLGLMLPDGPDRTRISFDYYFHPKAMGAEHGSLRAQRREEWETVAPQDEAYVEGVQANAAIRDKAGIETRFAPAWEGAVRIFQQSVLEAMKAEG